MCLITLRKPNLILPFENFKQAVENNPDGYGLSFPEEGKLKIIRSAEKPDPEKLYKFLHEDLKDRDIMLHLRYNTAGETNLRNSHPFPVLEKDTDGIDLRMAHNGTIHKFKTKAVKDESDTRAFVRMFVRPLFKRMSKAMSPEELLKDTFIKELLEEQIPNASVLTFLDGDGNTLICNKTGNGGKEDEGVYYSNVYSFKENYRNPPQAVASWTGTKTSYPSAGSYNRVPASNPSFAKDTRTKKFTTVYNIKDKKDLLKMSDEAISYICADKSAASLLIKELLLELGNSIEEIIELRLKVKQK